MSALPSLSLWVGGSSCPGKQALAVFCATVLCQPVRVLTILANKGDFIPPIPAGRFRVTQSSQDPYCTALHDLSLGTLQGRLTGIDK